MSDLIEMAEAYEQARRAPDPMDRAAATAELARLDRISAIRARLQGEGRPDCLDCGFDIPAPRRAAVKNAVRCKPCQDHHDEREARRYG